jgi:hypothetical protein
MFSKWQCSRGLLRSHRFLVQNVARLVVKCEKVVRCLGVDFLLIFKAVWIVRKYQCARTTSSPIPKIRKCFSKLSYMFTKKPNVWCPNLSWPWVQYIQGYSVSFQLLYILIRVWK